MYPGIMSWWLCWYVRIKILITVHHQLTQMFVRNDFWLSWWPWMGTSWSLALILNLYYTRYIVTSHLNSYSIHLKPYKTDVPSKLNKTATTPRFLSSLIAWFNSPDPNTSKIPNNTITLVVGLSASWPTVCQSSQQAYSTMQWCTECW